MLVHDFLINSASRFPNKEALVHGDKRYTYAEILTAAQAVSSWLRDLSFPEGFRTAILSDDPFEYIASYFGTMMAGGIAVGLNTQTSTRSLEAVLSDCTPSAIFLQPKHKKYFQGLTPSLKDSITIPSREDVFSIPLNYQQLTTINPRQSNLALLIYTSGTTGSPKGVMLRHANLVANTKAIIEYLALTEHDKVMAVLPFYYSYGNSVMLTHLAVGGTLIVNQRFLYPNVILDQMVAEKVTGFSGVPSTYAILLHRSAIHDYSFPDLRYLTQAGAAMAPELAKRLQSQFPSVQIFIMYGQTEASARLSYLPPDDLLRKPGSIGKAIPGVTLKLLDKKGQKVPVGKSGEIVATGGNIMAGYWGKPDETAKVLRPEGLWTGDLAKQDEEGYFFIISRKSDMIKSGSHRIAPKEIEELILVHDSVLEAAVVGVPDEILGETIKACIVLKQGVVCSEKELTLHCKKNLPAFKVPHSFEFFNELPKTATGKIKKKDLTQDRQVANKKFFLYQKLSKNKHAAFPLRNGLINENNQDNTI